MEAPAPSTRIRANGAARRRRAFIFPPPLAGAGTANEGILPGFAPAKRIAASQVRLRADINRAIRSLRAWKELAPRDQRNLLPRIMNGDLAVEAKAPAEFPRAALPMPADGLSALP